MTADKQTYLGEFEQLVLLAMLRVGKSGYGMEVLRAIEEHTDREVAIGAVYATLDRLEQKGLVSSSMEKVDGARSRRIYALNGDGLRALRAARETFERMAKGLDLSGKRS